MSYNVRNIVKTVRLTIKNDDQVCSYGILLHSSKAFLHKAQRQEKCAEPHCKCV